jgi:integrase
MATNVQQRGARFQLRVTHKLLPKPFFFTFDTEPEARDYGLQLDALLARGVVPAELLAPAPKRGDDPLLVEIIRAYSTSAPITDSDSELLDHMLGELAGARQSQIDFRWVDNYLRRLKLGRNIAPSTIRKRIGVLGRVLDWHLRRTTPNDELVPPNAFRLLPRGYSNYSKGEAGEVKAVGKTVKRDIKRDRRLRAHEDAAIEVALAGTKRDDRERALDVDPALTMLYRLMLDTGLRLSEAFPLRVDQVDLKRGLLLVDGSKGHRGELKPRVVPIKAVLVPLLRSYCSGRVGRIFPFWAGTPEDKKPCSARLSGRLATVFEYAGVDDFTTHDLRHEATCRWVEMRNAGGGWTFSEVDLCKIMGWTSTAMMLRYASLRGEDLANRLKLAVIEGREDHAPVGEPATSN